MTTAQGSTSGRTGGKRRAPMSCDRCKSRKTKCVDPVPGPCQFCKSINAVCHLDPSRRRQRPYYHVSEEEFRYMTKALEHFLPNVELNLQSLRDIVQSFEAKPALASPSGSSGSSDLLPVAAAAESTSSGSPVLVLHDDGPSVPALSTAPPDDTSTTSIDEIDDLLHGELGWLRVDSRGTYRHVGADSGYGFHAAVRSLPHRRRGAADDGKERNSIVAPCTVAPPSPTSNTPASSSVSRSRSPHHQAVAAGGGFGRRKQIFLPRRDLCNRCVSRFFRDVQSVYWFLSAEHFYAVLDRLYAGDSASATPATLCSLYCILALTCESEGRAVLGELNDPAAAEPPPAAKYLSLAKSYVSAVCDEADIDSVRALCLLGLALQSSMFSNTAYIYIGAAARIALTLGLHLPRNIEPRGCLQRQMDLRLYSTLFLLDLDIALCYGNPPALSEEHAAGKPNGLSEQFLSPGSYMPLDYLTVSCDLAQIKRRLSKLLYGRAAAVKNSAAPSPSPRPSIAAVNDLLARLQAWYAAIPPHLRDIARAPSFHQRSVSVLLLRYWSTTIFATRPFLLYRTLHAADLARLPPAKRSAFEDFGNACVEAARQSLLVIESMSDTGSLSSLMTVDTGCLLEDLQVFLLAAACGQERTEDVRSCLRSLQGMEQLFWTNHALTEVTAQLEENGLLNGEHNFSPHSDTPGHFFLDISQQQNTMMTGMMEAYFSDIHDPFFPIHNDTASPPMMLSDPYPDPMVAHGEVMATL